MTGFAQDWLALREPADLRARDAGLLARVAAHLAPREQVTVTDLGCGTGSTLRALRPVLPVRQTWRLVDRDPVLLAAAARAAGTAAPPGTLSATPMACDLRVDIEAVVALEADLVTTSAFLDLVSADWISRFAAAAARHRRPVYAALSYDGRTACEPPDPVDAAVLAAFNAHQLGDKGLGGALGPAAADAAVRAFAEAGFEVASARADWLLDAREPALQQRLVLGWHEAVGQTGLVEPAALDGWLARRRDAIAAGVSRLSVGHRDLWAVPR
jgi:hypothetical protein